MGGGEGLCRGHLQRQAQDGSVPGGTGKACTQDGSSAPRLAEVERQIGAALRADARGGDERVAAHGDGKRERLRVRGELRAGGSHWMLRRKAAGELGP